MKVAVLGQTGRTYETIAGAVHLAGHEVVGVLEDRVSPWRMLRRRARRLGVARALDQAIFRLVLQPALRRLSSSRVSELERELEGFRMAGVRGPRTEPRRVGSVNSHACREVLRHEQPNLVVLAGCAIVGDATLGEIDRLSCPVVNIHVGITPTYRGSHGGYWALVEGRPELCGVTLHEVDQGIDTGVVIGQDLIRPTDADSIITYPLMQLTCGVELLLAFLAKLDAGASSGFTLSPVNAERPVLPVRYSPGFVEYVRLWLREGIR